MLYFDYIGTVHELCPNGRISRKCHELGVKKLKINQTDVDNCVKSTFENNGTIAFQTDDNLVLKDNL